MAVHTCTYHTCPDISNIPGTWHLTTERNNMFLFLNQRATDKLMQNAILSPAKMVCCLDNTTCRRCRVPQWECALQAGQPGVHALSAAHKPCSGPAAHPACSGHGGSPLQPCALHSHCSSATAWHCGGSISCAYAVPHAAVNMHNAAVIDQ